MSFLHLDHGDDLHFLPKAGINVRLGKKGNETSSFRLRRVRKRKGKRGKRENLLSTTRSEKKEDLPLKNKKNKGLEEKGANNLRIMKRAEKKERYLSARLLKEEGATFISAGIRGDVSTP